MFLDGPIVSYKLHPDLYPTISCIHVNEYQIDLSIITFEICIYMNHPHMYHLNFLYKKLNLFKISHKKLKRRRYKRIQSLTEFSMHFGLSYAQFEGFRCCQENTFSWEVTGWVYFPQTCHWWILFVGGICESFGKRLLCCTFQDFHNSREGCNQFWGMS